MDNQHKKIKGYRDLSQEEIDMMNEIKQKGIELHSLIMKVDMFNHGCSDEIGTIDTALSLNVANAESHRWSAIAKTDFQTGLMALTRAVAKPEFF